MNELQKIAQELQRLSEEPVTKESYAKMLDLFQAFLASADEALGDDSKEDEDLQEHSTASGDAKD